MTNNVAPLKRQNLHGAGVNQSDRAPLAHAIDAWRRASAAVDGHRTSIERADQIVAEAEDKVLACRAAVAAAKQRDAAAMAEAIGKGVTASANSLRAARTAEAASTDELEAAEAARERLRQDLGAVEEEAAWRKNEVFIARSALLAPFVEELLSKAREARRTLTILSRLLPEVLQRDGRLDGPLDFPNSLDGIKASEARRAPLVAAYQQAERFMLHGVTVEENDAAAAAAAELRAAIGRLATDAGTELPA